MKKTLILSVLILIGITVNAQMTLKPHLGLNFSLLSTDQVDYNDPAARAGAMLGVSLKFGVDWYLEPGVQWTNMTYELVHASDNNLSYENTIQGIRIPLMGGYQFGANDDFLRLRIFAGPAAVIVTGVKQENQSANVPQKNDFSDFSFGINGGAGLDVWFLYVDIGYEVGLTSFYSNTATYGDGKNDMFWVTVGVNLGGQ